MITLTAELIDELFNNSEWGGCSITKVQAQVLGMNYPLIKGWPQRLIGKQISETDFRYLKQISNLPRNRAGENQPSLF